MIEKQRKVAKQSLSYFKNCYVSTIEVKVYLSKVPVKIFKK